MLKDVDLMEKEQIKGEIEIEDMRLEIENQKEVCFHEINQQTMFKEVFQN